MKRLYLKYTLKSGVLVTGYFGTERSLRFFLKDTSLVSQARVIRASGYFCEDLF